MHPIYEVIQDEYLITTDTSKLNVDLIHTYLSKDSYWAQNIPKHFVETAIHSSLCFGLFYKDQQIGFARVVTDKATFAYLADVFVVKDFRGKGLSKWLMQIIHAYPELQNLRRWMLATKDAHGLYEQFGWKKLSQEEAERCMTIVKPDIYNQL